MTSQSRRAQFKQDTKDWAIWWQRPFAAQQGKINWRGPNFWTAAVLFIALLVCNIPARPIYLGFLDRTQFGCLMAYLAAGLVRRVASSYATAIEDFKPSSPLDAKRANEQVKLSATLINAAAGAAVTVFALSELVRPDPNFTQIVFAVAAALWVHTAARTLLGLLKDESTPQ